MFRAVRWRMYGGCRGMHHARWHRRWHRHWNRRFGGAPWARPIDLGDLGDDFDESGTIRAAVPSVDISARVDEVLRGLELNNRQAAEAGDVVSILRSAIGPRFHAASEVLLALRAVGKTPFDVDLADAALGPRLSGPAGKEARDALEHLHNILTEDQRAALLRSLPRS
jgi:hypothetical protein